MSSWTALKNDFEPCLWVGFANIDLESAPWFLKDAKGNLQLKGFEGVETTGHWLFRGKHTVLLIKSGNDWAVCVDTGSQEPPGDDLRPDLRMIGYLQGHPFNISVFHRISADGQVTGHAHSKSGHVGGAYPLSGSPVPFIASLFRVDFFDLAMEKLKSNPKLFRLLMVPTGQHFLAHGETFESNFSHGWIALESLVNYGMFHGLIPKEKPKLADRAGWSEWVDERSDEIKEFATPGNEETFINTVRGFSTETSKVRGAFKSLGLPWTAEMDVLGKLRGQYIHEGTARNYDPQTTHNQIALLRIMLSALYARILGYEGPISDESGIRAPSWWEEKATKPTAELVVLEAGSQPG